MSPRRYGKTSLALNSFSKIKWPYAHIDLYKALDEEDIEKTILNGIGELLGKLETVPGKLLKLASNFFISMHVKVVLGADGLSLEFGRRKQKPTTTILEALEKLHKLARKKNKKVIIFMDEFQTVGEITNNSAIEASIREAAQKSINVAYVFSGSDRYLIQEMFSDKKRPFYKLCNLVTLDKISKDDYTAYIQKASNFQWKRSLTADTLEKIFYITERHPYYVNKLCSMLWVNDYPTKKDVVDSWQRYVLENKSQLERELELLSINQRKLLIFLAQEGPIKEIFSKETTKQVNISLSSVSRSLSVLIAKDYIYSDEEGNYKIRDPLIRDVLL
ncbi:MAG: hypothetical protein PVG30_06255 [Gammaproteobacteria bacterium]|jgi:AAA+ ATPase superfamily predicted ATPase